MDTKYTTKFRAFQLDSEGSLFSFYTTGKYTLIEARLPKGGIEVLANDLQLHNKDTIDVLHITSWDIDHCNYQDLVAIINAFRPSRIEVPDYNPESKEGKLCQQVILGYDKVHEKYIPNVVVITQQYIKNLPSASTFGTSNIVYKSAYQSNNKNDMSLIKLFRSNGFSVLSLGDCESEEIAARLLSYDSIQLEVDVLILPHHGAENGFLSGDFLDGVKPQLAVCSSNYDNKFDHPVPSICALITTREIPLMTTKRGDVIIVQETNSDTAYAINLISDNEKAETPKAFRPKREFGKRKVA